MIGPPNPYLIQVPSTNNFNLCLVEVTPKLIFQLMEVLRTLLGSSFDLQLNLHSFLALATTWEGGLPETENNDRL